MKRQVWTSCCHANERMEMQWNFCLAPLPPFPFRDTCLQQSCPNAAWWSARTSKVAARTSPSDFLQQSFCEVFPRFILFSNHHSKAGYIKEPLVLLISQRLVGNVAANGITSRVWIQSFWHYLPCLSTGSSILSGSCWKLFTVLKK